MQRSWSEITDGTQHPRLVRMDEPCTLPVTARTRMHRAVQTCTPPKWIRAEGLQGFATWVLKSIHQEMRCSLMLPKMGVCISPLMDTRDTEVSTFLSSTVGMART